MLYIKDTLTNELQRFKPLKQEEVKIYFCWPTVYNFAHIWNLKTYVFEDYTVKTLKYLWYKTKTTMNLTDIDDKTIKWSIEANEKLQKFTQKYSEIFLEDIKKLNITPADNIVPISTLIDEMVEMINWLIKKWYAYISEDNSIYYNIKKFKKYWELAHLDFSWMKESVRINNDEYTKEQASDFVLWKAYKENDWENFWEKDFVLWEEIKTIKWRPGWHIECSACNTKYFWAQIDIHMWWVDLVFPHHQNEIAQSEAYHSKPFSKYWIHGWHLTVDGKKMSKSANNFYTLKDIESKYKNIKNSVLYRAIRLSFMNSRYYESTDFSFEKLESNMKNIEKIDNTLKKLNFAISSNNLEEKKTKLEFRYSMQEYIQEYVSKLEDNFNTTEAISVFLSFINFINIKIDEKDLYLSEAKNLVDMLENMNFVLGLVDFEINNSQEIPEEIQTIFDKRNEAKKQKDFTQADKYRDELLEKWYKIIDDRNGSYLEKI